MKSPADRIEKTVLLKAPRARVWQALTDAEEFGVWFGVNLKGKAFKPGKRLQGKVTNPGYEHFTWKAQVEDLAPERLFSWRWHPGRPDPKIDYAKEPETLVEFKLKEVEGGTLLTLVESGFDKLAEKRRSEAYRDNEGGWDQQMKNIRTHLVP